MKKTRRKQQSLLILLVLILIIAGFWLWYTKKTAPAPETLPAPTSVTAVNSTKTNPAPNSNAALADGTLQVHMLDVGHGDCLLLISPSGNTLLIDAGENGSFEEVVEPYLENLGMERLDIVMHSHAHTDHIGAMDELLAADYDIGCYLRPAADAGKPTKTYERLLASLAAADFPTYPLYAADSSPLNAWDDAVTVRILSPLPDVKYGDVNDTSLVLKMEYGSTSILLTGDAESKAEREMMGVYRDGEMQATLLKVAHHSSTTGTTLPFLQAVGAQYAMISCSTDYKNPKQEVLKRLTDFGIPPEKQYITLYQGTIVARLDGTSITFTTEK